MMTEDYVSFETAKLLKEKGFDWEESPFYSEQDRDEWRQNNNYTIPNTAYDPDLPFDSETITLIAPHVSLQMAMKWLRETYNIGIFPLLFAFCVGEGGAAKPTYGTKIISLKSCELLTDDINPMPTYEQACEAAIKFCLENLI